MMLGFPGDSDSKESACDAGDLGSIPGLGRSLGEWNSSDVKVCKYIYIYIKQRDGNFVIVGPQFI